jgi:hypothetical protein
MPKGDAENPSDRKRCNGTRSSLPLRRACRLSIKGPNDAEPEIEGRKGLELRGTLVEPIRNVQDGGVQVVVGPRKNASDLRGRRQWAINRIRPAVDVADRCIGELYPLLSGSVQHVTPAGLPGVQRIQASPRFRVLATVNDANLDDIVSQ